MRYGIITPAHNEESFITGYMQSVIRQTIRPDVLVIVNDHSTDSTAAIARNIAQGHDWIRVIDHHSRPEHSTGSKVIRAFLHGLHYLDAGQADLPESWDLIAKIDADLILPDHYFQTVIDHFGANPDTGICGGVCAIMQGKKLSPEKLTDRYHVRGALKTWRRQCYKQIGGIGPFYGWDTLDELLADYHGWKTAVIPDLIVTHRSPTGSDTSPLKLHRMTGEMFYRIGYDTVIALAASLKRFRMTPFLLSSFCTFYGYIEALLRKPPRLVDDAQARHIRRLRYRRMKEKLVNRNRN